MSVMLYKIQKPPKWVAFSFLSHWGGGIRICHANVHAKAKITRPIIPGQRIFPVGNTIC